MNNNYEIRGDIAVIFLKKRSGEVIETIIDVDDLEKARSINGAWHAAYCKRTNSHYVLTNSVRKFGRTIKGKATTKSLHRFLHDEIPAGMVIDHINRDTLDNRRSSNLRITTIKVNNQNRVFKKKTS